MALVNQILETCIYVSDIEKAAVFYEALLDLEPHSIDVNRHVFFKISNSMFLLFNPDETKKGGVLPAHGATGQGHIGFAIGHDELDFWRVRLRNLNIPVELEFVWPSGGKSIYFRDPFMNSVELATSDTWDK